MFKLFEHLKYMLIYKIVNSWNFDGFPNCSILKKFYCSQLNNFRNYKFFEFAKLQILLIFEIDFLFEFAKLQIFGIFQI